MDKLTLKKLATAGKYIFAESLFANSRNSEPILQIGLKNERMIWNPSTPPQKFKTSVNKLLIPLIQN